VPRPAASEQMRSIPQTKQLRASHWQLRHEQTRTEKRDWLRVLEVPVLVFRDQDARVATRNVGLGDTV